MSVRTTFAAAAVVLIAACASQPAPTVRERSLPTSPGRASGTVASGDARATTDRSAASPPVEVRERSASAAAVNGAPRAPRRGRAAAGPRAGAPSVVELGMMEVRGFDEANESIGLGRATTVDARRAWEALIDDVNARGGIGGRRIEGAFHRYDTVSAQPPSEQFQRACEAWTADRRVAIAFVPSATDAFAACMRRHGVPVVSTGPMTPHDAGAAGRAPNVIDPVALNLDRQAIATVGRLADRGWLRGGRSVGVVTFDAPTFRAALGRSLLPALRSRHGGPVEVFQFDLPEGHAAYGMVTAQAQSAVLRFRARGVDRVLFLDVSGIAASAFVTAAADQGYRPRYGLNSQSGNTTLIEVLGPGAAAEFVGALSIGWMPTLDLRSADDDRRPDPARRRCLGVLRRVGVEISSRNAETIALGMCDALELVRVALAGGSDPADLPRAVRAVAAFAPATTYATAFVAGRNDGVAAVADLAFDRGCSCFRRVAEPTRIP